MDLFEEILSYGLTFILQGLVVWPLFRGVEPVAPVGEEVPIGVLVSLFEGIVPSCFLLIIFLVAEYHGKRELWQVAIR